jgi:stearoyl-CoA desaturase (delta-9 desaturase)
LVDTLQTLSCSGLPQFRGAATRESIRMTMTAERPAAQAQQYEYRSTWEHVAFYAFVIVPMLAVVAAIVLAVVGRGVNWLDVGLAVGFYVVTANGITIGYHRLLTHRSFKANRPLKIVLAIAGSMAIQGGVIRWVADHRKHHQNSDADGDPHSPWKYGGGARGLTRGLWWSHTGWLFDRKQAIKSRYAPDLLEDRDLARIHALFPLWVAISVLAPPAIAWTVSGSFVVAAGALLWASLVRIFLLHHVTFAINSICHVAGRRPFKTRDRSTNFWPLAVLSMGESWHNYHHADPTSARHGIRRGQLDSSARLIRGFELLGWAWDVQWPDASRIQRRQLSTTAA